MSETRELTVTQSVGPEVGIVLGSGSDTEVMQRAATVLGKLGISHETVVRSAHRTPEDAVAYARSAQGRGMKVIIAGAGMAAHLAGVLAAHTLLPVIGVPLSAGPLQGIDALLSTVQMPSGTPVATVAINGAENAAYLAAHILALSNPDIAQSLHAAREERRAKALGV